MSTATRPLEVVVHRGALEESCHRVHAVVAAADGGLVAAHGVAGRPTFARSAVKAIQALALVETGAADRFGFGPDHLALACSSHSGTPLHVATAAAMLAAAGLDEAALACGAHWPLHDPSARELARGSATPTALHNNCSGKHAGFLAVARHLGLPVAGYETPDHPVQQRVATALADLTGVALAATDRAIDGCSVPTFAVPLDRLAVAFARLGTGEGLSADRAGAAARLRAAVAAHPLLVAGPGRFDTRVIEAWGGRVFVKSGAEGVLCAALPEAGLGIAVKAEDGAQRASEVALASLLRAHLPGLSSADHALLADLAAPTVSNWRGIVTGGLGCRPVDPPSG